MRRRAVAMAGEGDTVFALTDGDRYGRGALLMRSDDAGRHFQAASVPSQGSRATRFEYSDGIVQWDDEISRDGGQTWRKAEQRWYAAEPWRDGSGKRVLVARYGSAGGLMVVGDEPDDWVKFDTVYTDSASLACDPTSGCWLLAGGTLYRPAP